MKKKKTSGRKKHPPNPPKLKTNRLTPGLKDKPGIDQLTEKKPSPPQGDTKTRKQKVVNEQEQNQIINDMEETRDAVEY